MRALPSPNGSNGRRADGRFATGNPGGPGNPHARQTADIRRLIREAVTDDDLRAVVRCVVKKAKAGEPWAVKELLDRLAGKSTQATDEHAGQVIHPHIGTAVPRELTPEEQATLENL